MIPLTALVPHPDNPPARVAIDDDLKQLAASIRALAPMEQAREFAAMAADGLSQTEIARRTGYSPSLVNVRLMLLQLSPASQRLVEQGRMSAEEALADIRSMNGHTPRKKPADTGHFGSSHPLAGAAADRCREAHERRPARRLGPACGPCWEATIRVDAAAGGCP